MRLGVVYSVIAVFLWAVYDVIVRYLCLNYDLQPFVFVSFATFFASLSLLFVAGRGKLGLKTIKQYHTWAFSCISLIMDILFVFILFDISTTEANLMLRLSIITTALICRFALARSINKKNYISYLLIFTGFLVIALNLPEQVMVKTLWLVFFVIICQSFRTYFAETHPQSNQASRFKDNCRVTGLVMLVTSFVFMLVGWLSAFIIDSNFITQPLLLKALQSMPSYSDFTNPVNIISAGFVGVFNISVSSYFYFQGTKKIGSDMFLTVSALLPLFTLIMEYLASLINLINFTTFTYVDLLATALILSGALLSILIKLKDSKNE